MPATGVGGVPAQGCFLHLPVRDLYLGPFVDATAAQVVMARPGLIPGFGPGDSAGCRLLFDEPPPPGAVIIELHPGDLQTAVRCSVRGVTSSTLVRRAG